MDLKIIWSSGYIMVGWGICEKYQSRDSQISRAGMAREILSSDWNFSQLPSPIVIFLFNYTKYTFVPGRMRLHRKGLHGHHFHLEAYFFYENATGMGVPMVSVCHICRPMTYPTVTSARSCNNVGHLF